MQFTIEEVHTKKQLTEFIVFPNFLYKHNPYYVPPLIVNERQLLDPRKNPAFEFCKARYWLTRDSKGNVIGRIAGIINHRYNEFTKKQYIRFGWFDVIDNLEVTHALLKQVIDWGIREGMTIIHGPLGFQEFDVSGILIDGFDQLPTIYGKYNFPYYSSHLEKLNFQKEVDWVEYLITIPEQMPERITKMKKIVEERYGVRTVNFKSKKHLLQYADQIFDLLIREYISIHGFYPLTSSQTKALKNQFFPLLQLPFVSVVVDPHENVIGFGICMPSLSRAFQKAGGKLFPLGWYYILKALKNNSVIDTLLIAIDTHYREKGITALIFDQIGQNLIRRGYKFIESTRQLEHNHLILNLWNKLEYRIHKRARCYWKYL